MGFFHGCFIEGEIKMSKNVEALIEILNDKAKDAIYRSVWCEHVK